MNMLIRPYSSDDEKVCMQIYDAATKKAHSFLDKKVVLSQQKSAQSDSSNPDRGIAVIEKYGKVVGFISFFSIDGSDNSKAKLPGIFISPKSHKKGFGSALLNFVQAKYSHINLAVYVKNRGAITFYESRGFVKTEEKLDKESNQHYVEMNWEKGES